jgi:hypothetical protein
MALPADIGAATRSARVIKREDATIAARYPGARTQDGGPARGYFDTYADADTALGQRAALIGVERRRFAVTAHDLVLINPAAAEIPAAQLVDAEQAIDAAALIARVEVNLDAGTTSLELFG